MNMKRLFDWKVMLGIILIILSAIVYFVHYLIFGDVHHIFIYMIGDIAFVFLEVLLVTLILHRLLLQREKQVMLNKLNMVIGVFFSEIGTELLEKFSVFDRKVSNIVKCLLIRKDWSAKEFYDVKKYLRKHDADIVVKESDLEDIKKFLLEKRQFFLNLLENPNLLEHESFTDLLWAVFHLMDELNHRNDLNSLPDTDYEHLAGDTKRVYHQLILQWLDYMGHLKSDYPYLFSLAIRTNPFDADAKVIVSQ